jgi:tyrosinase
MGSNGEFFPHGATHLEAFGLSLDLPAGTGGGCLKTGPFKDLVVSNRSLTLIVPDLTIEIGQLGSQPDRWTPRIRSYRPDS